LRDKAEQAKFVNRSQQLCRYIANPSRKPKQFLAVTGMNLHQFQELLPHFEQVYERLERV